MGGGVLPGKRAGPWEFSAMLGFGPSSNNYDDTWYMGCSVAWPKWTRQGLTLHAVKRAFQMTSSSLSKSLISNLATTYQGV